jgi:actin-like ATPase involved in cell morphogenesis
MDLHEARIEAMQEKTDTNQKEKASQEHIKEEIMADMKTQVGCLASCTDVNQEKAEVCHREMKTHQERAETTIHSIQSKLEETIKHQVEDVLPCVDQRMQSLCK